MAEREFDRRVVDEANEIIGERGYEIVTDDEGYVYVASPADDTERGRWDQPTAVPVGGYAWEYDDPRMLLACTDDKVPRVDELVWERDRAESLYGDLSDDYGKADFKAAREELGLTQGDVADACDVRVTAVKRWERPGWPDPPEDAWDVLRRMRETLVEQADAMVDRACDMCDKHGIRHVVITYYRLQEDHDRWGREPGPVGFVNAVSRRAADFMRAEGIDVSFAYPQQASIDYDEEG